MNEENKEYSFHYTAPTTEERKQIEEIRRQYLAESEQSGKLKRLQFLDQKVKSVPTCVGLTMGVIGLTTFGLGLTCVLEWALYPLGVGFGVVGVATSCLAYCAYKKTSEYLKKKHRKEILDLCEELAK
jgi:hypothetical protein